jgi:hypothetical protein
MRDRLIEILSKPIYPKVGVDLAEVVADYLLDNGVMVPPCKVGDTVWFNTFKKNATVCVGVQPHKIDRIDISFVCDTKNLIETHIHDWEIGKTVFLTREEAEKALAERSGE